MMRSVLSIFIVTTLLTGCAGHSFPLSNRFVFPAAKSDSAEVFADTNGTFYPSGWQTYFTPMRNRKRPGEGKWIAGSLLAQSIGNRKFRTLIERDEARQLGELKSFAERHQRIFILVHGYNASVEEASIPFSQIEAQLDLKPGDGVVRFYWDGLIGKGAGAIKVWFKAANVSQIVGSRALRGVLTGIEGRDVYIIAHSRGASVVLSALGNPVYDSEFLAKTKRKTKMWGKRYNDLLSPNSLPNRANSIHVLLLAPAIDRIDFCDQSEQPLKSKGFVCSKLRLLGSDIKSIDYTVNPSDPMLGKLVFSSQAFNPTGLGYDVKIGRDLKAENYPMLRENILEKPESFHAFEDYVAHPVFFQMLNNVGIGKSAPAVQPQSGEKPIAAPIDQATSPPN